MILKINSTDDSCVALRIKDIMLVQKINLETEYGIKILFQNGLEHFCVKDSKEIRDKDFEEIVSKMGRELEK